MTDQTQTSTPEDFAAEQLVHRYVSGNIDKPEINICKFKMDDAMFQAVLLERRLRAGDVENSAALAVNIVLNGNRTPVEKLECGEVGTVVTHMNLSKLLDIHPFFVAAGSFYNAVLVVVRPTLLGTSGNVANTVLQKFGANSHKFCQITDPKVIANTNIFGSMVKMWLDAMSELGYDLDTLTTFQEVENEIIEAVTEHYWWPEKYKAESLIELFAPVRTVTEELDDLMVKRCIAGNIFKPEINICNQSANGLFRVAKQFMKVLRPFWGLDRGALIATNFAMNGNHVPLAKLEIANDPVVVTEVVRVPVTNAPIYQEAYHACLATIWNTMSPVIKNLGEWQIKQLGDNLMEYGARESKETRPDIIGGTDLMFSLVSATMAELSKFGVLVAKPVGEKIVEAIMCQHWSLRPAPNLLEYFSFPGDGQQPKVITMQQPQPTFNPAFQQPLQPNPIPQWPLMDDAYGNPSLLAMYASNNYPCWPGQMPPNPMIGQWPPARYGQPVRPQFGQLPEQESKIGEFVPGGAATSAQMARQDFDQFVDNLDNLTSTIGLPLTAEARSKIIADWVVKNNYLPEVRKYLTLPNGN